MRLSDPFYRHCSLSKGVFAELPGIEASCVAPLHVWWGGKSKPSYIAHGDSMQEELVLQL